MERDYNLQIVKNTKSQESINFKVWQANSSEGNMIDYKELDASNKSITYEFGFGLSYSFSRLPTWE
jgi:beta-glucosidase